MSVSLDQEEQHLTSIAETESMIDLVSLDLVNKQHTDPRRSSSPSSSTSPPLAESDVSSVSTKSSAAATLEDDADAVSEIDILKARWKEDERIHEEARGSQEVKEVMVHVCASSARRRERSNLHVHWKKRLNPRH